MVTTVVFPTILSPMMCIWVLIEGPHRKICLRGPTGSHRVWMYRLIKKEGRRGVETRSRFDNPYLFIWVSPMNLRRPWSLPVRFSFSVQEWTFGFSYHYQTAKGDPDSRVTKWFLRSPRLKRKFRCSKLEQRKKGREDYGLRKERGGDKWSPTPRVHIWKSTGSIDSRRIGGVRRPGSSLRVNLLRNWGKKSKSRNVHCKDSRGVGRG